MLLFFLILFSCNSNIQDLNTLEHMIGDWNLISTSGGKQGEGFNPNFNQLFIEKDFSFHLVNNDQDRIGSGSITHLDSIIQSIDVLFIGTSTQPTFWTELINDPEKTVEFEETNKMNLISPCCDRFNLHFEKN